jgi:hypothetical protein
MRALSTSERAQMAAEADKTAMSEGASPKAEKAPLRCEGRAALSGF